MQTIVNLSLQDALDGLFHLPPEVAGLEPLVLHCRLMGWDAAATRRTRRS